MHDGMPYDRIQGQGQGHELVFVSRDSELDRTGLDLSGDLRKIFSSNLNEIQYIGRGR